MDSFVKVPIFSMLLVVKRIFRLILYGFKPIVSQFKHKMSMIMKLNRKRR